MYITWHRFHWVYVYKNCNKTLLFLGKGGKNRRRGKNENETEKRELVFKEDGQEYAQVTKMLGNGRLEAMCFDGTKRLCHIRGKLRKKVLKRKIISYFLVVVSISRTANITVGGFLCSVGHQ